MSRDRIKILLLHGLILLAIGQWLIVPLQEMVEEERQLQREYAETINIKQATLERYRQQREAQLASPNQKGTLLSLVYSQTGNPVELQSQILEEVIQKAQKEGLAVLNFELPEPGREKTFIKVPLVLRVNGLPKGLIAFSKSIKKMPKRLLVKQFAIQPGSAQLRKKMAGSVFLVTLTLEAFLATGQPS